MPTKQPFELASSLSKSEAYFRHLRWGGRRTCPRCHERRLYRLQDGRYRCARCRYSFGDFTGTYLGQSRIRRDVLAHLLYLFVLGVPAYRAGPYVPVSLSTVERTFRLFRQAIYDRSVEKLQSLNLAGEFELDETMFGGHRPGKRGWGAHGKHIVFAIYQRNGFVVTFPVPNRRWATLRPIIEQHTERGSVYYTDDYQAYVALEMRGKHQRVTHKRDEFVRGHVHLNGVEGFWSFAKIWLYHYRGVPRHYFPQYLKEIEFRFNRRDEDLFHILAQYTVNSVPTV